MWLIVSRQPTPIMYIIPSLLLLDMQAIALRYLQHIAHRSGSPNSKYRMEQSSLLSSRSNTSANIIQQHFETNTHSNHIITMRRFSSILSVTLLLVLFSCFLLTEVHSTLPKKYHHHGASSIQEVEQGRTTSSHGRWRHGHGRWLLWQHV